MLKKTIIPFMIIFIARTGFAQTSALFSPKYTPGQEYQLTQLTKSNVTMDMKADEATMKKIADSGTKLPLVIGSSTNVGTTTTTGTASGPSGSFPIQTTFTSVTLEQSLNGKDMATPGSALIGKQMTGNCTADGKAKFDSIPGTSTEAVTLNSAVKMINGVLQQIKFPDKPLKVGDTFLQEIPMAMPMAGINMEFTIKSTYKLTAINGNEATFSLDQSANMTFEKKEGAMAMLGTGTGTGDGTLKYNIAKNFITDMTNNLNLKFIIKINELAMTGDSSTSSVMHANIVSK